MKGKHKSEVKGPRLQKESPKKPRQGRRRGSNKQDRVEKRQVKFMFNAPDASEVFLAGSFNEWDNHSLRMKKARRGVWSATVELPPGSYEYKVRVDGEWVENAFGTVLVDGIVVRNTAEASIVDNPFGTQNLAFLVR
jgi:1,4-alpha-glucan branching enzyme